jgi:hypothetical protein
MKGYVCGMNRGSYACGGLKLGGESIEFWKVHELTTLYQQAKAVTATGNSLFS